MEKTIAAVATGNAAAGIGVIRISGSNALDVAEKVFVPADGARLSRLKGYRAKYGSVMINGAVADNGVALVFRAPKSYTGEDVVEISVHGGIYIVEKTLEAVLNAGACPAEAGEFTKRAFLNGKMDLAQAESVADIISAQGEAQLKASFSILDGALSGRINKVLEILKDCSANMAAWVDYPDEDIPELTEDALLAELERAKSGLAALLQSYDSGQAAIQGIDTAIIGRTNVGKSTLMNLLSGRNRSIVTDKAGTTRDIIEETVRLGNIVLHLNDTAGLRCAGDEIEAIGIDLAEKKAETAALIIAVFDCSREFSGEDEYIIEKCRGKKCLAVINKTDLETVLDTKKIEKAFEKVIYISAKDETAPKTIESAVKELFGSVVFDGSAVILANKRQKNCCREALSAIDEAISAVQSGVTYDAVNVLTDSAIDSLLCLTGKKATQEVVDNIFSKFCVGK